MTDFIEEQIPATINSESTMSLKIELPKEFLSDVCTFASNKMKMKLSNLGNRIETRTFSNGITLVVLTQLGLNEENIYFYYEKLPSKYRYNDIGVSIKTTKIKLDIHSLHETLCAISHRLNEEAEFVSKNTIIFVGKNDTLLRIEKEAQSKTFSVEIEVKNDVDTDLVTRGILSDIMFELMVEIDSKINFLNLMDSVPYFKDYKKGEQNCTK